MKTACIGEAMVELSLKAGRSEANIGFAGDTLNTAAYLQRTLEDNGVDGEHSVSFVTALGTDSFSQQIVALIESENISAQSVRYCSDRVPGLYAINTDDAGERTFTYWRDQSAARTLFTKETGPDFNELLDFDLLYYSAISLAIMPEEIKTQWLEFLEHYRTLPGKKVAFDSNYRPKLWASTEQAQQFIKAAYLQCDIALPSVDDEMAAFTETSKNDVLSRLASYGINCGVLKCGAQGPVDLANVNTVFDLPLASKVVDSTAAGDSFNGAYLAGVMSQKKQSESIAQGHACAMRVIGHRGAIVERKIWNS